VKALLAGADLASTAAAFALAARAWGPLDPTVAALGLLVWWLALARAGLYSARLIGRRSEELRRLAAATLTGAAALLVLPDLTGRPAPALPTVAAAALGAVLVLAAQREAARRVFRGLRRRGRRLRPLVIIGDNAEGRALARAVVADQALGWRVVGFVRTGPARVAPAGRPAAGEGEPPVLGHVDDVLATLADAGAASVVIAASAVEVGATTALVRRLLGAGVEVELSPALADTAAGRLQIAVLGRFPVIRLRPRRLTGWRAAAKRAFDLLGAGLGLALTALPMAVVAAAIKLDSPGPVLYRQRRVGRDGAPIRMLKFRTMHTGADAAHARLAELNEADGPLFKMRRDPRVTRVGRLLRQSSIDELPQLWNVLRGEMSLVGPRPALPEEAAQWSAELRDRLRVRPGMTGMWQVSGRSDASFEEYSRLDLYYVDNWSLLTDLAILARTAPAVLAGRGAR
ncbi:MAG: sugar transferase, partial [Acidimicrobiales bacterium]